MFPPKEKPRQNLVLRQVAARFPAPASGRTRARSARSGSPSRPGAVVLRHEAQHRQRNPPERAAASPSLRVEPTAESTSSRPRLSSKPPTGCTSEGGPPPASPRPLSSGPYEARVPARERPATARGCRCREAKPPLPPPAARRHSRPSCAEEVAVHAQPRALRACGARRVQAPHAAPSANRPARRGPSRTAPAPLVRPSRMSPEIVAAACQRAVDAQRPVQHRRIEPRSVRTTAGDRHVERRHIGRGTSPTGPSILSKPPPCGPAAVMATCACPPDRVTVPSDIRDARASESAATAAHRSPKPAPRSPRAMARPRADRTAPPPVSRCVPRNGFTIPSGACPVTARSSALPVPPCR